MKPNVRFEDVHSDLKTASHTMDLYSRTQADGPLVLWKRAVQVVPLNAFERIGRWIKSGHYVINHNGDAVVVHCGNATNGHVSLQFVDSKLTPCSVAHSTIEPVLLGKMVVSEEQQAAVFEGKRLSDFFKDEASLTGKPNSSGEITTPGVPRRSHKWPARLFTKQTSLKIAGSSTIKALNGGFVVIKKSPAAVMTASKIC